MTRRHFPPLASAGLVVLALLLAGCAGSQDVATARMQNVTSEFFTRVRSEQVRTEAAARALAARVDGASVVAAAQNRWRGGRSVAVRFVVSGRAEGSNLKVTVTRCFRLDLPGGVPTADDWIDLVADCAGAGADDLLPPELPIGADRTVHAALTGDARVTASPREQDLAAAIRHSLPPGVDVTTGAAEMPGDIVAPGYGYPGGTVLAARATFGADCLLVWAWPGGHVAWHPGRWGDTCRVQTPDRMLQTGSVPSPDDHDPPLATRYPGASGPGRSPTTRA